MISLIIALLIFYPFKYTVRWNRNTHDEYASENIPGTVRSGIHTLASHIYGADNKKGLVIISHGMGVPSDYYIPEARYLAQKGYKVVLFDDTGYWKNKGLFLGFPQATKDLVAAVRAYADGELPLTLIGHSMGAYAVCTALPQIGSQVHSVVAYSGFDSEQAIIAEFVDRQVKHCKSAAKLLLRMSQAVFFPKLSRLKASKCLTECGCPALIIHGTEDKEVSIGGASIYAQLADAQNPRIRCIAATAPSMNTHMGVVRPDGSKAAINEDILRQVEEVL